MEIADFPFARLPKVSRRACAELRRAARRLPLATPDDALEALASLLGVSPLATPAPIEICPKGALTECVTDPLVAVVFATAPGPRAPRFAVELDARLAACVVDRALGGEAGPAITAPRDPLPELACGVLEYVAARVAAACTSAPRLTLRGVVTSPAALLHAIGDDGCLVWPASVTLGSDHGVVRAWIPDATDQPTPRSQPSRAHWLRAHCVTLALEGGTAALLATELASLGAGDVVLLDRHRLRLRAGVLEGSASVRALGSASPQWHAILQEGDAILNGPSHGEPPHMPNDATHPDPIHAALDVVGDAPIDLRVELARVALTLAEISELRPGEVIVTGRPLGAEVVLRAGERAVATGELVDVEGELGVRIVRLGA
jgi:type III secretion system YscQ/HrcQ family protein